MFVRSTSQNSPWLSVIKALLLLVVFAVTLHANAQAVDQDEFTNDDTEAPQNEDSDYVPGLGMQMPSYAGTGCPQGTLNAVLSPDQRSLSILFDSYIARAGGNSGQNQARLACQIRIPFSVPPGYKVQVVKMQYRGFTSTPQQARTTVSAGFRFLEVNGAAVQMPSVLRTKIFNGPREKSFVIGSRIRGQNWTGCGKSFVLAAESELSVMTGPRNNEVLSTIDSLDAVQMPVVYSLRWKQCQGRTEPVEPPLRPQGPGRHLSVAESILPDSTFLIEHDFSEDR